jgi:hypothetical protein
MTGNPADPPLPIVTFQIARWNVDNFSHAFRQRRSDPKSQTGIIPRYVSWRWRQMKLDLNNVGDKFVPKRYPRKFSPALATPRRLVRGLWFDNPPHHIRCRYRIDVPDGLQTRLPYGLAPPSVWSQEGAFLRKRGFRRALPRRRAKSTDVW